MLARRDQHLWHAVFGHPWAILSEKLTDIVAVLEFHASGGTLSPAEIRARIGSDPPTPRRRSQSQEVAVIPVFGVLARRMDLVTQASGGTSTDVLAAHMREAVADPAVRALLLVVDSPGGTVAGITETAAVIREARTRKPVTAMIDGIAASAAYWLASQAGEVVITPSGDAGSIGILAAHQCVAGALEQAGVATTVISAGRYKDEGNPFVPLTADARAALQHRVDLAYRQFVGDIALGRGVPVATVEEHFGQGRMLPAVDALAAGLVDRIEPFDVMLATLRRSIGASRSLRAMAASPSSPSASDPLWRYRAERELLDL